MAKHMKTIIRRMSEGFIEWCADNSAAARLERTVVQGLIGIGAGIATSAIGGNSIMSMFVAPIVMVVLSPIQAHIGKSLEE